MKKLVTLLMALGLLVGGFTPLLAPSSATASNVKTERASIKFPKKMQGTWYSYSATKRKYSKVKITSKKIKGSVIITKDPGQTGLLGKKMKLNEKISSKNSNNVVLLGNEYMVTGQVNYRAKTTKHLQVYPYSNGGAYANFYKTKKLAKKNRAALETRSAFIKIPKKMRGTWYKYNQKTRKYSKMVVTSKKVKIPSKKINHRAIWFAENRLSIGYATMEAGGSVGAVMYSSKKKMALYGTDGGEHINFYKTKKLAKINH